MLTINHSKTLLTSGQHVPQMKKGHNIENSHKVFPCFRINCYLSDFKHKPLSLSASATSTYATYPLIITIIITIIITFIMIILITRWTIPLWCFSTSPPLASTQPAATPASPCSRFKDDHCKLNCQSAIFIITMMMVLQELAREGRTIICTIHQPSAR